MKRLLLVSMTAVFFMAAGCMPVADAGKDLKILNGLDVTLDGSNSTVKIGKITNYGWDFGDGVQANGITVKHKYAAAGSYEVTLTVKDNTGFKATDKATVSVIDWDVLATPVNAGGHVIQAPLVDFLPDGRMVIAEGNSATEIEIAVETSENSKTFNYVTSIIPGTQSSFGSFIKASDADTVVLGASTHIYKINLVTGEHSTLAAAANFDAVLSGSRLYFTWSSYNPDWSANSHVSSLDIDAPGTVAEVISDIPGASAGVCLDGGGNIYTGNGYSNYGIPNETGLIKRFALSDSPQTWADGDSVAKVLSATPLIYAGNDTILTAGGDIFGTGDANYFAAIDASTGDEIFKLDPDSSEDSYYKLSAGNGRFTASIWNYTNSVGTLYLLPFEALGL